ncbi:hypothetical protein U472_11395 [Orenia metallireducens]|uniref:Methyl-accepting transducer domain-containing protein n=1 Tax=Orenia metallireducens TaxID=1413210 RepID=A0A1C0A8P3_9FIRM|nr:sugar diacid recognition domain-containing protein [Orenia metallireducens]OCL26584.1 hypothetical protein U472_11395 [Orenia metallireducens]
MSWNHRVTEEQAKNIVDILHKVTGNNVNFMGAGGKIIATKQPERLGTIHESAKRIMEGEVDYVAVTAEEANNIEGVLPGYNGPIELDGKRIGCIGITGEPSKVKPLQELAAIIVTEEIKKDFANRRKEELNKEIAMQIEDISVAIQEIVEGSEEIASNSSYMEEMSQKIRSQIEEINNILRLVTDIVKRTRLLGLNASIEAAKAGEEGRGFAIVAEEVRNLSSNSANSVKKIEEELFKIKDLIANISDSIYQNSDTTKKEAETLQYIKDNIINIERKVVELIK